MKLREPVTIVIAVFAAFYFGEWAVNKINPPPKQCWYEYKKTDTETMYRWEDCKEEDILRNSDI